MAKNLDEVKANIPARLDRVSVTKPEPDSRFMASKDSLPALMSGQSLIPQKQVGGAKRHSMQMAASAASSVLPHLGAGSPNRN